MRLAPELRQLDVDISLTDYGLSKVVQNKSFGKLTKLSVHDVESSDQDLETVIVEMRAINLTHLSLKGVQTVDSGGWRQVFDGLRNRRFPPLKSLRLSTETEDGRESQQLEYFARTTKGPISAAEDENSRLKKPQR